MAHQPSLEHYQKVQLFKSMPLGAGSYGVVCKATCDELPCAAKLLHPILFQLNDPGAPDYARKFEQECCLFSEMKHPHIVQHLGTTTDPDTSLPVILMELMDESLTQFLDCCKQPLPYHTEVNLCHNIALALAYLHSKELIHRDLSSNNILLIGSNRAKIADFGMSSLAERMKSLTRCPGATVYMPPEAFQDPPVYSKKLDCFSFGVLNIQITTCHRPEPGPAEQIIEDPRSPVGMLKIPIPESTRRKSHIDLIRPDHPLLSMALSCLSYREEDRPSAQELCHQLTILKENPLYTESTQQNREGDDESENNSSESHFAVLQEQNERQAQLIRELQEKLVGELQLKEKIEAANQKLAKVVGDTEMKLQQLNNQLQEKGETVAQLRRELTQKEEAVSNLRDSLSTRESEIQEAKWQVEEDEEPQAEGSSCSKAANISLSWGDCTKAPEKMARGSAVSDSKMSYFNPGGSSHVHSFDSETESWGRLPDCPCYTDFSLAVVNGKLTTVGGFQGWWVNEPTNVLLSLTDNEDRWEKLFPPMPTKRHSASAVCSERHLIVIGGMIYQQSLRTVEVMDADTLQWFMADRLSRPLSGASVTLCGDMLYLAGGGNHPSDDSLVELRVSDLIQSCQAESQTRSTVRTVWQRITHTQVSQSTCVTLCGQLLAIGGKDSDNTDSPIIQSYDPETGSWQVLSVLSAARARPLVVNLPDSRLMVVGGAGSKFNVGFLSLTYRIIEIAHVL